MDRKRIRKKIGRRAPLALKKAAVPVRRTTGEKPAAAYTDKRSDPAPDSTLHKIKEMITFAIDCADKRLLLRPRFLYTRPLFRRARFVRRGRQPVRLPALLLGGLILIIITQLFFRAVGANKSIDPKDVAAFRLPPNALTTLWDLSLKYQVDYTELLTVYALDNRFFAESNTNDSTATNADAIERAYMMDYSTLKARYPVTAYEAYYRLIDAIFDEANVFPVSPDAAPNSYMYGDSYGTEKYPGEKTPYYGTDLIDRDNINGRIAVTSIGGGTVDAVGWNESDGYYIAIKNADGVLIQYANLSDAPVGFNPGDVVAAGQSVGTMGASAHTKKMGARSNYPVHLQIKIEVETTLAKGSFWFNPYPLLRLIEYQNLGGYPPPNPTALQAPNSFA